MFLLNAETHVRRLIGIDHFSHVAEREQKQNEAQEAQRWKATTSGIGTTSSAFIEGGKNVVPQMARKMAQHDNQRTIDLSEKQKKDTFIAELKARGEDNYTKIQKGPNAGESATKVNELRLRNMLRDANGGSSIVMLKPTSAGNLWKTQKLVSRTATKFPLQEFHYIEV